MYPSTAWLCGHKPQEAPAQEDLSTYMMDFLSPSSPAEGEERSVQVGP